MSEAKTGRIGKILRGFGIGTAYPTIEETSAQIKAERMAREEKFDLDNLKSFLDNSGSRTFAARTDKGFKKALSEIRPTTAVLDRQSRTDDVDGAIVTDTTFRCDRHGYFVRRTKNIKETDRRERVGSDYFERFDERDYKERFSSK